MIPGGGEPASIAQGEARHTYAHSVARDPRGHAVAEMPDGAGRATARTAPAVTARVRRDRAGRGRDRTGRCRAIGAWRSGPAGRAGR